MPTVPLIAGMITSAKSRTGSKLFHHFERHKGVFTIWFVGVEGDRGRSVFDDIYIFHSFIEGTLLTCLLEKIWNN